MSPQSPPPTATASSSEDREERPDLSKRTAAYEYLCSKRGPPRFAQVTHDIFRGGQPTTDHLQALADLGVRTVINLRRGHRARILMEKSEVHTLGMQYHHRPFWGLIGGPSPRFVWRLVKELASDDTPRPIYIHCQQGRDRTSLIVAAFRVAVQQWSAKTAWEKEALAYGHRSVLWYRHIRPAFLRFVRSLHPS